MISLYITTYVLIGQGLWARTFGGAWNDRAYTIAQAQDGGYAVGGWTMSFGAGGCDFLVCRLSPSGEVIWTRAFGTPDHNEVHSMVQTSDGGFAAAGWGRYDGPDIRFFVIKIGSPGNLVWAKSYGADHWEGAYSITQTTDGGYAVAGFTGSFGVYPWDVLVIKLDPSGEIIWAKTFGGTYSDYAFSVIQTFDGGYALAGGMERLGMNFDILVIRLDPQGNLRWAKTFENSDQDHALSIIQTSDGGYAVAGYTGYQRRDGCILKLDSLGDISWAKTIGGDIGAVRPYSIHQTFDGGYTVGGAMYDLGAGGYGCFIFNLDPQGILRWSKTFGLADTQETRFSLIPATDGGFAVAGITESYGAGTRDFLVFKTDTNGNYPDCIRDFSPTVTDVDFITFSPFGVPLVDRYPWSRTEDWMVTTPNLIITDVCEPLYEDINEISSGPQNRITCSLLPGAVLFLSPYAMPINIYSADGRLAYSGDIMKGANRIPLEIGVYIWKAGTYEGKAVVR